MSDIFISYSSKDRAKANEIADALKRQGWSVWWDRYIPPGNSFDEIIEKELDSARCVIVLWSRASVLSDWVKAEAAEGARRKILVPVLIENVKIPLGFRRIQTADLLEWKLVPSNHGFEGLVKAVAIKLGTTVKTETMEVKHVPGKHLVQEVNPSSATSQLREKWRAELVSSSLVKRTLRVHLSQSVHEVEFHNNMGKLSDSETIKVDGIVVSQGGNATTWKRRFEFHIVDGDVQHPVTVELEPNIWLATIKKFRLTIAGKILYTEGSW